MGILADRSRAPTAQLPDRVGGTTREGHTSRAASLGNVRSSAERVWHSVPRRREAWPGLAHPPPPLSCMAFIGATDRVHEMCRTCRERQSGLLGGSMPSEGVVAEKKKESYDGWSRQHRATQLGPKARLLRKCASPSTTPIDQSRNLLSVCSMYPFGLVFLGAECQSLAPGRGCTHSSLEKPLASASCRQDCEKAREPTAAQLPLSVLTRSLTAPIWARQLLLPAARREQAEGGGRGEGGTPGLPERCMRMRLNNGLTGAAGQLSYTHYPPREVGHK